MLENSLLGLIMYYPLKIKNIVFYCIVHYYFLESVLFVEYYTVLANTALIAHLIQHVLMK